MAEYQILYWQDIPAQLKAYDGRRPVSRQLPERFQTHIDRTAMDEGLYGSDDYLDQWHWSEREERDGSALEVLDALEKEILAKFHEL